MSLLPVLGIVAGAGLLVYMVSNEDAPPVVNQKQVATRNVLFVAEDYKDTINNPLYTKNRFAKQAVLTGVSPGEMEVPQYEVEHAGMMTRVYRMPTQS